VGLAVFLFIKNQDINEQLQQKTQELLNCQAEECKQCEECKTATTYPIKVYFSKSPESIDDPTKVYGVDRTATTLAVATYAINQLIAGPTADEAKFGYFSDVKVRNDSSICNNNDFKIAVKDTVATLQFCRTFDAIGTMSDARAQEEIKASLLQFPTVKKVVVLSKSGNCQFDLSGLNLCLQ